MYAAEGAEVIFNGRREENGKAIENNIIANGGSLTWGRILSVILLTISADSPIP